MTKPWRSKCMHIAQYKSITQGVRYAKLVLYLWRLLRAHRIAYWYGGIWKTLHCRLCINCYGTGWWVANVCGRLLYPSPPPPTLAGSLTFQAKTTVHCSPDSSMPRDNTMSNLPGKWTNFAYLTHCVCQLTKYGMRGQKWAHSCKCWQQSIWSQN